MKISKVCIAVPSSDFINGDDGGDYSLFTLFC